MRTFLPALGALLLLVWAPARAHDMTVGGSRWFLGRDGIVATLDLDASLLARMQGVDEGKLELDPADEARLARFAEEVVQPYVDRKLAVAIDGSIRRARVDRVVKAGVWQIWLSVHDARRAEVGHELRIDYRLLLDETNGTHVNLAYLYLSQEARESAQRTFDFAQPTWQTAFERGSTTWSANIPPAARETVASRRSSPPVRERSKAPTRTPAGARPAAPATPLAGPADAAAPPPLPHPGTAEPRPTAAATDGARALWGSIGRFLLLGIEHILTGYDHIAFLLALIVVAPSLRAVLPIVTAFTAAHSITLLLAALRIITLPPALVEPAIAVSICYVAAENLFRRGAAHRWLVTFCFGLVHGFGFASALRDLIVGRTDLVVSVVAFNVGVELGQLMIFALMLPVLRGLGRLVDPRKVVVAASVAIGALGCTWVLERGLDVKILPSF